MNNENNTYKNVWDALCDNPEEAQNMRMRSQLIIEITDELSRIEATQKEKAKMLGISQPRLNDLLQGHIHKFSLDMLVKLSSRLGKHIELSFTDMPADMSNNIVMA